MLLRLGHRVTRQQPSKAVKIPGLLDIPTKLLSKARRRGKRKLIPQPPPRHYRHLSAIECFGEIQQVGFHHPRLVAKSGLAAHADRSGENALVVKLYSACVDPIARKDHLRRQGEVNGGHTDGAATLLTFYYVTIEHQWPAHAYLGPAGAAAQDEPPADRARYNHHMVVIKSPLDFVDHLEPEAALRPEPGQQVDIPFPPTPETEIRPLDDRGGMVIGHELIDEPFRWQVEQVPIRVEHDDLIRPGLAQGLSAAWQGHQVWRLLLRPQQPRGMRVKGEGFDLCGVLIGELPRPGQNRLVTGVHAIEVTNGDDTAPCHVFRA